MVKLDRKRYSDRPGADDANVVGNICQTIERLVNHS